MGNLGGYRGSRSQEGSSGDCGQKQDRGVSRNMKGQSKTVTKNMEKWPLIWCNRKKPLDSCSGMIGVAVRKTAHTGVLKVHVRREER